MRPLRFLAMIAAAVMALVFSALPALAQSATAIGSAALDVAASFIPADPCILYGGLIAIAVTMAKRIPFVGRNPKTAAAILSALSASLPFITRGGVPLDASTLALLLPCIAMQFASAIAVHEVAVKPVARGIFGEPDAYTRGFRARGQLS